MCPPRETTRHGKRFFRLTESRLKLKIIREKGLKTALNIKKRKGAYCVGLSLDAPLQNLSLPIRLIELRRTHAPCN